MTTLAILVMTPMVSMADMDRCVSYHGVDFEKKHWGLVK